MLARKSERRVRSVADRLIALVSVPSPMSCRCPLKEDKGYYVAKAIVAY